MGIFDLSDYLGGEYRESYSGRFMLGKQCPAFDYGSEKEAILDMLGAIAGEDDKTERDGLRRVLQHYQIDQMGQGVVLYFPRLAAGYDPT